ncbi:MAG: S8 family serine peptidase [Jatrophihabitans sp.]
MPFGTGAARAAPAPACSPAQQQTAPSVTTDQSGYLTSLQPQAAWALTRGAGVTVALLDTGVASPLSGTVLSGRLLDGGNHAGDSATSGLLDCDGRGTSDAGLIAGHDGSKRLPGIAPDATILSVRIQAGGDTPPPPARVAAGIDEAVSRGAKVIVVAAPCADSSALKASVQRAIRAGTAIVAAVGDDPSAKSSYPAQYDNVIGVSVLPASGGSNQVQGKFVDVVAPGTNLAGMSVNGQKYRLGYSGSSAAAALVGGTVALMRAASGAIPVATIVSRLEYSADHPAAALPSPTEGWGTVNPYAALALPASMTAPPSPAAGPRINAVKLAAPDQPGHRFAGAYLGIGLIGAALAAGAALAGVRRARRRRWETA